MARIVAKRRGMARWQGNKPLPLLRLPHVCGCVYLGARSLACPAAAVATFTAADCGQMCECGNAACRLLLLPHHRSRLHTAGWAGPHCILGNGSHIIKTGCEGGKECVCEQLHSPCETFARDFSCWFFSSWLEKKGGGEREERPLDGQKGKLHGPFSFLGCGSIQGLQPRMQIGKFTLCYISWLRHRGTAGQPCEFCR